MLLEFVRPISRETLFFFSYSLNMGGNQIKHFLCLSWMAIWQTLLSLVDARPMFSEHVTSMTPNSKSTVEVAEGFPTEMKVVIVFVILFVCACLCVGVCNVCTSVACSKRISEEIRETKDGSKENDNDMVRNI